MHVEQTLIEAIAAAASEFQNDIEVELEQPAQLIHGDYSTNVAMKLARVARKPANHCGNNKRKARASAFASHSNRGSKTRFY